MAEKLTRTIIEDAIARGLPTGKAQTVLWDARCVGLGLKIRASGVHSWVYVYRPRGAGRSEPSKTITIGGWPVVTLDIARAKATALAGQTAEGKDPSAELRKARTREKRILSAAIEGYVASIRRRKLVAADAIESGLNRDLAPIANREIDRLERSDFTALIEGLEAKGKPGAAGNLRKYVHSLLEWSLGQGLIKHNVLAGLRRARSSRAERLENPRAGRALSDDQIAALWASAGSLGPFGGLIQLGLLTGLRRGELAGLKWSDIHSDRIVIAADKTKMGVGHSVPLTALMRTVLSAQSRTMSPLVFPSTRTGAAMEGWSKLLPKAQRESGVNFRLHDLRRTVRTLMSRLGVSEEIGELSIGHVRKGLVGIYNFDLGWEPRAAAFEKVSIHVVQLNGDHGWSGSPLSLAIPALPSN